MTDIKYCYKFHPSQFLDTMINYQKNSTISDSQSRKQIKHGGTDGQPVHFPCLPLAA